MVRTKFEISKVTRRLAELSQQYVVENLWPPKDDRDVNGG